MKTALLLLLLLSTTFAMAQDPSEPQIITQLAVRLGLNEGETEGMLRVYRETDEMIHEADLELDIYRAQLAKLLYSRDVDMGEVEKLLRTSYEWQLKRQLAQIRRQVEIRRILGDERWSQYSRIIRNMQQRDGTTPQNAPARPSN